MLKPIYQHITLLYLMIVIYSLCAFNTAHANEFSHHVHGQAELTIAIEQSRIEINFQAPAESLLGFEHQAVTKHELEKVSALKKQLSQQHIIRFKGGNCQAIASDINTDSIMNENHQTHAHPHAEIMANYIFECADEENITSASVMLFTYYPTLNNIHAMWVTQQRQGSTVLSPIKIKIN